MTQCAAYTVASAPQTAGDNLECRMAQLFLSADPADAANIDTYCPGAQGTATAPCQ